LYGLAWGTGVGIIAGLFFALARGLTPREVALRVMPNQGIRWTAYNAARVSIGITLVTGMITGFVRLPGMMLAGFVNGSLPYGMALGLFGWAFFGGLTVIQHISLRLMLWQRGFAPLNYAAFLDHCAERILLRKVGGGYLFAHRLLLAYFADLEIGKPKRNKLEQKS